MKWLRMTQTEAVPVMITGFITLNLHVLRSYRVFPNTWISQQTSPAIRQQIKTRTLDNYYRPWYTNVNNTQKKNLLKFLNTNLNLNLI